MPAPDYIGLLVSHQATTATTNVLTLGSDSTLGAQLVLGSAHTGAGNTVSGIVDSRGNTWTIKSQSNNLGGNNACLAVCDNAVRLVTGDTITVTYGGSCNSACAVGQASGMSLTADASGNNTGSSATPNSTITTVAAETLTWVVGAIGNNNLSTFLTEDADYTTVVAFHHTAQSIGISLSVRDRSSAGADTWQGTWDTSGGWNVRIVSFGAAAPAVTAKLLSLMGVGS